jgi:hypothetical protein
MVSWAARGSKGPDGMDGNVQSLQCATQKPAPAGLEFRHGSKQCDLGWGKPGFKGSGTNNDRPADVPCLLLSDSDMRDDVWHASCSSSPS